MQDVFVLITDFLLSAVRLIQEDLLWLGNYFRTLGTWGCVNFLFWLMIYVLFMSFALFGLWVGLNFIVPIVVKIPKGLFFTKSILQSNDDFRAGYEDGYEKRGLHFTDD